MERRSTVVWRLGVVGLFIAVLPAALYTFEARDRVHTELMLGPSVSVGTISHVEVDKFGDSVWGTNTGSGILVSAAACEVWTNHHVIADAAVIEVFPRGWRGASGISATVVNSTPRNDLAILRMERCEGVPEALLGDSDRVRPGEVTYAVGNPLGRNPDSITRGIISHTRRDLPSGATFLQTDAAINPGSSGGALFDRRGEVIGLNTAIANAGTGTNVGVGFAIPINTAKRVVAELHQGPPSWGDAGFAEVASSLTPDEAAVFRVPDGHAAIVITRAPEGGPSAGELFAHDVIFKIDGTGVTDVAQAMGLVAARKPGSALALELIRDGEIHTVEIILGEGWQGDEAPNADAYEGHLGLTLEMWSGEAGERGRFETPVITKVHSLGPAHKAQVSSSQNSIAFRGPVVVPFMLDVKTVTGVAFDGTYHEVESIAEVERYASLAFEADRPLLLEIELWARRNPRDVEASLEHMGTGFFKVKPALARPSAEDLTDLHMAAADRPAQLRGLFE